MSKNKQHSSCPVCGNTDKDHSWDSHEIYVTSVPDAPIAGTIDVQRYYLNPGAVARRLAEARADLKKYFPEKKFEIQPARYMLNRDGQNALLYGMAHVICYIFYET